MHATRRKQHNTSTTRSLGAAGRFLKSLAKANPLLADRAFVCSRCDVSWTGDEADCWNCGMPATFGSHHHGSALHHLLAATKISRTLIPTGAAS
ncbi:MULTISPECIES: hypothetical protein [unclassified Streptomyces]|uniref:hypothetical protein n=1 Tax=unclassified Streptomyces TaxID=2593676 RepID=UPI001BE97AAE|nr:MULTISPECIES: hypothetical protein [unclassified Streptomyces]MBT2406876.1 hypothetical protein [Streptomyces sp. ISL-21]MBT2613089.1 hypothetical protein [Streptomyces sp. ISL-87]